MAENKVGPKELKQIDVFNDYVAIWLAPIEVAGLEIPAETQDKMKNEGVVIGVGPDANKGLAHDYRNTDNEIKLGDHVVIRSNKYMAIEPKSGIYRDDQIVMVHKLDLVYRHMRHDESKYIFVTKWSGEDTDKVRTEHQ